MAHFCRPITSSETTSPNFDHEMEQAPHFSADAADAVVDGVDATHAAADATAADAGAAAPSAPASSHQYHIHHHHDDAATIDADSDGATTTRAASPSSVSASGGTGSAQPSRLGHHPHAHAPRLQHMTPPPSAVTQPARVFQLSSLFPRRLASAASAASSSATSESSSSADAISTASTVGAATVTGPMRNRAALLSAWRSTTASTAATATAAADASVEASTTGGVGDRGDGGLSADAVVDVAHDDGGAKAAAVTALNFSDSGSGRSSSSASPDPPSSRGRFGVLASVYAAWRQPKPALLTAGDMPGWYHAPPHILGGYRPAMGSVRECVNSLRYVHNETGNIWSHALGVVVFVALLGNTFGVVTKGAGVAASWVDILVLVALTALFLVTGFSALAPLIHAGFLYGIPFIIKSLGLLYIVSEGIIYILAVVFFLSHVPERWYPGFFDLWGHSHQIFHLLIVAAVAVHYVGVCSAYLFWHSGEPVCEGSATA
ncbi:hypothetical protein HK405_004003 [Cladochytrium tenue]|nr:hypothetical protein HK405_004003 [Cladochytrium tenue]